VRPTEVAVLRNTFFVLHFVSVSLISSTTVDVSDGNILSVLFFVCSNVRQERIVIALSVTALVQQIGFGDAVEYNGLAGIIGSGKTGRTFSESVAVHDSEICPFLGPQPVADVTRV